MNNDDRSLWHLYFQLYPSGLRTSEIEFGLLPTATAHQQKAKYKQGGKSLEFVITRILPTPLANDWKAACNTFTDRQKKLTRELGLMTGLKLQPNFVEWMMGYPRGWTDLNLPKHNTEAKD